MIHTTNSFDHEISSKLHNNLVIKQNTTMTTKVATMVPQQGKAPASSLKVKVASALAKTDKNLYLPAELVNDN